MMKVTNNYIFLIIIFFCISVNAADVQVQINGAILDQSCNIKSTDLTKNVVFDDLNPSNFPSLGSVSNVQEVNIELENCTGNIDKMYYIFSGDEDSSDPSLLKIIGQAGSSSEDLASGIAIQILDTNKKAIALNKNQSLNQIITDKIYSFKFYLRYKSTNSTVTPGDASSLLYLDFYYE
ncbi:fimbrial protein [Moellerella wisconsensis]|uniref:Fimbrial protein n=2 Tax=Moellerella wisconsensis TaxID=158849 RepID=A0ACD3Y8C6_9GAMM|nr:fimbrial protein [Moellerella wisconsensis]UNH39009.1 fimbrial protein [Moellerella wisconsensis]WJW81993.1 fimbrial protein [Moellerella wisconsensis]